MLRQKIHAIGHAIVRGLCIVAYRLLGIEASDTIRDRAIERARYLKKKGAPALKCARELKRYICRYREALREEGSPHEAIHDGVSDLEFEWKYVMTTPAA